MSGDQHHDDQEQKVREGLEHLQAAGLEVIAALRAFIDVAEDVIADPGRAAAAFSLLTGEALRTPVPPESEGDPAPSGITRIRIS